MEIYDFGNWTKIVYTSHEDKYGKYPDNKVEYLKGHVDLEWVYNTHFEISYWTNGTLNRKGKPARINYFVDEWFKMGHMHNEGGPARKFYSNGRVVSKDCTALYCLNDKPESYKDWQRKVKRLKGK